MARRARPSDELNITSMMDMMTIILCFLLKSLSATEITVNPSQDLKLPTSDSRQDPDVAVVVVISKREIIVGEQNVLSLDTTLDPETQQVIYQIPSDDKDGFAVPKLEEAFRREKDNYSQIADMAKDRDDLKFKGRALMQIDKDIPFSLLRDVMFNAGSAHFAEFEFVVIKGGVGE